MIPNSIREAGLSMEALGLYTWLTLNAPYEGEDNGIVRTSRAELVKATGLSERQVRTLLEKLVASKVVTKETSKETSKKTSKGATEITICYLADCKDEKIVSVQRNVQRNVQSIDQRNVQPRAYKNDNIISCLKEEDKEREDNKETIESINIDSHKESLSTKETSSWRTDKSIYDSLIHQAQERLLADKEYKAQVEELHPNIDYERTVKAAALFWLDDEQYRKYKLKRTKSPNFVSTLKNGLQYSRIWKNRNTTPATPVVHDMSELTDVAYNYEYFMIWVEKFCPRISGTINKGWPTSDKEYQHLAAHTEGGCKGLCYAMLQLEQQGYEKYKDDNGMMFIFANYIKANGMFIAG